MAFTATTAPFIISPNTELKKLKLSKSAKKLSLLVAPLTLTACIDGLLFPLRPGYDKPIENHGTDGNDIQTGTELWDLFYSSKGADTIGLKTGEFEGKENRQDDVTYKKSDAAVNIDLAAGTGKGGHAEGDILYNIKELTGSDFDDILRGNDKEINGVYFGNDTIYGGKGNDTIYGGSVDTSIFGEDGNDKIYGGNASNRLDGGDGNDHIIGGDERDYIYGSLGNDVIDGGEGIDTISYDTASSIDLSQGKALSGEKALGDTYKNIENIDGSEYRDILIGDDNNNAIDGKTGGDDIKGGAGDDELSANISIFNRKGSYGLDQKILIHGEAGNDNLNLSSVFDYVLRNEKKQYLTNKSLELDIDGGTGNDKIELTLTDHYFEEVEDVISDETGLSLTGAIKGGNGNDVIKSDFDISILGGSGNDTISGDRLSHVEGNDGDDKLNYLSFKDFKYTILKDDNKIKLEATKGVGDDKVEAMAIFQSIEKIEKSFVEQDTETVDIKSIWSLLDNSEQAKFNSDETQFTAWLAEDNGYNYFDL